MIEISIPGRGIYHIRHLVTDVNGTLAVDGILLDGVLERFAILREKLEIHLLTADTHGKQADIDAQLGLTAIRIRGENASEQKAEYVRRLGTETVFAMGQGANDAGMLEAAALGVCVFSEEGAAIQTLLAADLCMPDVRAALDLLLHPLRITASLRQ